ncbi:MAG TPA: PilZ domain-containing protein [Candidatus Methylomirabilis sp.]|nr:PilZ domain-containing protein [Candidatus Methylomirabilis sp.]HSD51802.1 PilZ domain-containing protein [Candidatus Methylomirabilis sp.]
MSQPQGFLGERRFPRFEVALPVVGRAPQFPERDIHGTVRNIGRGGLMAEFPVELVSGSFVDLTLHTQNGRLVEAGRIIWVSNTGRTVRHGLAFSEPKGRDYMVDLFLGQRHGEGTGPEEAEGKKV